MRLSGWPPVGPRDPFLRLCQDSLPFFGGEEHLQQLLTIVPGEVVSATRPWGFSEKGGFGVFQRSPEEETRDNAGTHTQQTWNETSDNAGTHKTNTESRRQTHGQTNVGRQHSTGFSGPLSFRPLLTRLGTRRGTLLPAEPAAFQRAHWPQSCAGWNVQSVPNPL